jgi:hypothetical protein
LSLLPYRFFMAPFDFTQGWSGSPVNFEPIAH